MLAGSTIVLGKEIPASGKSTLRVRTSSKVLAEKSLVFKTMLTNGTMAESLALAAQSHVEIPLLEEEPEMFLLVLDAMHGRPPQGLHVDNLDLLVSLTLVVDRWQCPNALKSFVQNCTKCSGPTAWCKDVVPWLWIAMVRGLGSEASALASIAIMDSTRPIDLELDNEYDVPISERVISTFPSLQGRLASCSLTLTVTVEIEGWRRRYFCLTRATLTRWATRTREMHEGYLRGLPSRGGRNDELDRAFRGLEDACLGVFGNRVPMTDTFEGTSCTWVRSRIEAMGDPEIWPFDWRSERFSDARGFLHQPSMFKGYVLNTMGLLENVIRAWKPK